jgi:PDZ domain-containing protein
MTEARFEPRPSRRGRRLPLVLAIAVAVVVVVVAIASRISLSYYVLSPGDAQPVGPLITVPADRAHRISGPILLTDVFVSQVTALSYLPDILSGNDQVVPADELESPGIPTSELTAQGYLEMVQAKAAAKTAAFRRLGYQVPEHNAGAVIEAVGSGTPAYGALGVGQVVTAVDGVSAPTVCDVVGRLAKFGPGQSVTLSVEKNRFSSAGTLVQGPTVRKTLRLAARPPGLSADSGCSGVKAARGYLGVSIQTQQDYTFPFSVTINTADIGGPSAGLAMTLGLINTLSGGHLTGGRTVAATGTIDPSGDVGDVGGVAQKTIAVEHAGATVFFVPPPELSAARSKATPSLHVYAVSTLAQALSILHKLGGHVPPATGGH